MMRWILCAALLALALGCGKYGPPVRALPEEPAAANGAVGPGTGAPGSATGTPGAPTSGVETTPAGDEPGGPIGDPLPDGSVPPGEEPITGLGEPPLEGEGPSGIDPGQGTLPEESSP